MRKFIDWFFSFFEAAPSKGGRGNYEVDDPHDERHDPQKITRILHDDEFLFLERPPN